MTRLEITLTSGTTISADARTWELHKNAGRIARLTWNTPEGASRRLAHVNVDEIVAVVVVTE